MDNRLNIIRHLYREADDPAELGRLLDGDEALRREYQALSEVKFHLEQRTRPKPDASVLEAVLAAAARPAPAREDRPARPSPAMRRLRAAGLISAVLAVLAAVGLVLWTPGSEVPISESAASFRAESPPPSVPLPPAEPAPSPESAVQDLAVASGAYDEAAQDEPAPEAVYVVPDGTRRLNVDVESAFREEVAGNIATDLALVRPEQDREPLVAGLDWDGAEDVRRLHRQVALLEARSTTWSWNDAVQLPAGIDGRSGFQPAGRKD